MESYLEQVLFWILPAALAGLGTQILLQRKRRGEPLILPLREWSYHAQTEAVAALLGFLAWGVALLTFSGAIYTHAGYSICILLMLALLLAMLLWTPIRIRRMPGPHALAWLGWGRNLLLAILLTVYQNSVSRISNDGRTWYSIPNVTLRAACLWMGCAVVVGWYLLHRYLKRTR
jgi:hypothetical protein